MTVIGITGRYCAGKSFVGSLLEERGIPIIEVDQLGHKALIDSKDKIVKVFGASILDEASQIDRKKVGNIVFGDLEKLRSLEAIVHPAMVLECEKIIEVNRAAGKKITVINAALLQKMGLDKLCDTIMYAYAPTCIRFKRSIKRDKATLASFRRVEKAQREIRFRLLKEQQRRYIVHIWLSRAFIYRQVQKLCATMRV